MKNIKVTLGFAIGLLILGWVGHQDYKTYALEHIVNTCERSGGPTMTATGRECRKMIDTVQQDHDFEVLSDADAATFWIESK